MKVVIDIPDHIYKTVVETGRFFPYRFNTARAIKNGEVVPKGHSDLIDRSETLNNAWKKFYEQENEHEKNIDGYDLMRDRFYEQSGFECCQQVLVNAPTIIEEDTGSEE